MQDKRTLSRIPAKLIADCARCVNEKFAAEHFISFTKDISLEGARLVASKKIKPGENLLVSLDIPNLFIPLLVYGEIVWTDIMKKEDSSAAGFSEAGIRFLKIDPSDAEKLEEFLSSE